MVRSDSLYDHMSERFHIRLNFLVKEVLKISGNKLARDTEHHAGLTNRYLKGTTIPNIKFIQDICLKYGISANWLIMGVTPIKLEDLSTPSSDPTIEWVVKKNNLSKEVTNLRKDLDEFIKNNKL